MPLLFRRILFIIFVVLFIVSAAVLLFYANGYRYHTGKRTIEKTGKLVVETEPRGARVLLNSRDVTSSRTPLTISSILSGEYEVTIEKEGFFSLTRRVSIAPGMSVVINDVMLIARQESRQILPLGTLGVTVQRGDMLYLSDGKRVRVVDMRFERERIIVEKARPITDLLVSGSGNLFVIFMDKRWEIRDHTNTLFTSEDTKLSVLRFRFAHESDAIYAQTDTGIVRFDNEKKAFIPLLEAQDTRSFFVIGNAVYRIDADGVLEEYRLSDGQNIRTLKDGPRFSTILDSSNGTLVVADEGGRSMYLFDREADTPTFQQVSDVEEVIFVERDRFFSRNTFEVWAHIFTPERYTRTLITRQSTPLSLIVPFTTRPFVLIASKEGEVRLRSLVGTDQQSSTVGMFDEISALALNQKETTLFILGKQNNKPGVYALTLIEEEQVFPLVK